MAGMLAGILIGGAAAAPILTGTMAAAQQAQLNYSREDERQADQLGFKYSSAGGFDPLEMIETLKKIRKAQIIGTDSIPPYLLTHPGGTERMSNFEIMSMSSNRPLGQENEQTAKYRKFFPLFKTILTAKYSDPLQAESAFKLELEKDPQSTYANFGLGIVWRESAEYNRAIGHFEKALKREPDSVLILRNLAETYQLLGQDGKAIEILSKALDVYGRDKGSLYLLAMSYQNLERYSKAIKIYEKLKRRKPVRNEVFYNLGVSYGRRNQLAHAHYNFGIYFARLFQFDKARFHFQKAESLSGNDPALQKKIKKIMNAGPFSDKKKE
jgi:predicted Zn-dependent protease